MLGTKSRLGTSLPHKGVSSITLSEWQTASPSTHSELSGLYLAPNFEGTISLWNQKKWLEVVELRDGLSISAFDFAGTVVIPLDSGSRLSVHIQPKISPQTAATFILYALGFDRQLFHSRLVRAPLEAWGLIDLLAYLFLQEVDRILASGISHEYQSTSDWLMRPRGRIVFSDLARQSRPPQATLPCRYDHRSSDTTLNQLLQASLRALETQVANRALKYNLHARADFLSELCSLRRLDVGLLRSAKLALDRRTLQYIGAVALAEMLLDGTSPGFGDGPRHLFQGYLFSMNSLFERFVARLCHEFAPPGYEVVSQGSIHDAYRYVENPYRWQRPSLRPDLLVRYQGTPRIVFDTKYKVLDHERPAASDLYQLTLYSMAFGRKEPIPARLIYPTVNARSKHTSLRFAGFVNGGELGRVLVSGLPLELIACALREWDTDALSAEVVRLVTDVDPSEH